MIFLQSNKPAKADFGGTAFIAGMVAGIAVAEISHYNLDKKRNSEDEQIKEESENEKEVDEEEFFKQDLSRTSTEDLKFGIRKRWAE